MNEKKPFYARNETITNVSSTKSSAKAQRRCGMLGTWYANIGTNTIFKMPTVGGHAFRRNLAQSHVKSEVQFEMGKVQSVPGVRKVQQHALEMKTETDVRTLATPVSPQQSFSCSKFEAPGRAMQMRTKKQISFGRNRNSKRTSCSALMKSLNFTYSDELNRFWLIRSIAWCQSRHYSAKDCVDRAQNAKTFSLRTFRIPNWHGNKPVRNLCRRTSIGWC